MEFCCLCFAPLHRSSCNFCERLESSAVLGSHRYIDFWVSGNAFLSVYFFSSIATDECVAALLLAVKPLLLEQPEVVFLKVCFLALRGNPRF